MFWLLITILALSAGKKRPRADVGCSIIKKRLLDEARGGRLVLPVDTDSGSESDSEHFIKPADWLEMHPSSHRDRAIKSCNAAFAIVLKNRSGNQVLESTFGFGGLQQVSKWHNSNLETLLPAYYNPAIYNCYPVSERKNGIAQRLSELSLMGDIEAAKKEAKEIYRKNPKAVMYRQEITKALDDGRKLKKTTNPLIKAVKCGNTEFAEFLIDQGVPPTYSADNSRTPLHIAASKANYDMVELLVKKGAHVCLDYQFGRKNAGTPLDIAIRKRRANLHSVELTTRYDAIITLLSKVLSDQEEAAEFYLGASPEVSSGSEADEEGN